MKATHRSTPIIAPVLEVLETRIAPAVFLVSSTSASILDSLGNDATNGANENAAETVTNGGAAVFLETGDKLFFDANGNRRADPAELLVTVTTGKAMAFFYDFDGDFRFSLEEFRGLAVTGGFSGSIKGSIFGGLATALDGGGNFMASGSLVTLQAGDITDVTISGRVLSMAAGGNITKITIGGVGSPVGGAGVEEIFTGDAVNTDLFSGGTFGGKDFDAIYNQPAATDGGSVTDVTAVGGARSIHTGNGGDAALAAAGHGGDILRIKNFKSFDMTYTTGHGGDSLLGAGGAGGDIIDTSITASRSATAAVYFTTGNGGDSGGSSDGGHGGNVANVKSTTRRSDLIDFYTGDGGDGGTTGGMGGAAGNVDNVAVVAPLSFRGLTFAGGVGGNGRAGGGSGGSLDGFSLKSGLLENFNLFRLEGGAGGDSSKSLGGAGGSVANVNLVLDAGVFEQSILSGGHGGEGLTGGGKGGDLTALKLILPVLLEHLEMTAGAGGDARDEMGTPGGAGGHGGEVTGNLITIDAIMNAADSHLSSGAGGASTLANPGGAGGAISGSKFTFNLIVGSLLVATGQGGAGDDAGAMGGAGGALQGDTFTIQGPAGLTTDRLFSTGDGGSGDAHGGVGGAVVKNAFVVKNMHDLKITAGKGGDSVLLGGDGGAVTRSNTVSSLGSINGQFLIGAGDGGAAGNGGIGGDGGRMEDVKLAANYVMAADFAAGTGGGVGTNGFGGRGGDLLRVSEAIKFMGGTSSILAGDGGSRTNSGNNGTGGRGGEARDVNVSILAGEGIELKIEGGDGKPSLGGTNVGGNGGGVTNTTVTATDDLVAFTLDLKGGSAGLGPGRVASGGAVRNTQVTTASDVAMININGGGGGGLVDMVKLKVGPAFGNFAIHGGFGLPGTGNGAAGNGGAVQNVTGTGQGVPALGTFSRWVIEGGQGGEAMGSGAAGAGGNVFGVTISDPVVGKFNASGGFGGDSSAGAAGAGGDVEKLTLKMARADVEIVNPRGGDSSGGGAGGAGGALRNFVIAAQRIVLSAGDGGGASTSTGGAGGEVKQMTLVTSAYVQLVRAGSGGNTGLGQGGGVGGSVSFVKANGDIGNFAAPFGGSGSGGIFAGQGGTSPLIRSAAGSVTDITAQRISSILAGPVDQEPDELTGANAVTSIARITAKKIGHDLDGDGNFDFINAGVPGFALGQGDTAVDGLVIVKAGGFDAATIPAVPLLKIEV